MECRTLLGGVLTDSILADGGPISASRVRRRNELGAAIARSREGLVFRRQGYGLRLILRGGRMRAFFENPTYSFQISRMQMRIGRFLISRHLLGRGCKDKETRKKKGK